MKIDIIGINFDKYSMLKRIDQYFIDNGIEYEYIEFLKKAPVDIDKSKDSDGVIFVEIDPIFENDLQMHILPQMDGRTIAALFRRFLLSLEEKQSSIVKKDNTEKIVQTDNLVKNLKSVVLEIGDKSVLLSKDDFDKFLEIKNLVDNLGYRVVEVITDEQQ